MSEGEISSESAIRRALEAYADEASRLDPAKDRERPTYGCTIYVARTSVATRFGLFTAYVFQDIIHKGYIVALAHGNIHEADTLHTRLHSSCVTSETLRGCDCDCVQQLEGAIQKIALEGEGILFYLLQEGRGVGYAGKARDRMLVQASMDSISTFEAYAMLGLKKDYRQYRNVRDICRILDIDVKWVILTNNPDKVEAMRKNGFEVVRAETLEYEPEPYNLAYLKSKAESGHILKRPNSSALLGIKTPEPVLPFVPVALEKAARFIYMATYFLPVRPVDDWVLLNSTQVSELFGTPSLEECMEGESPLAFESRTVRANRMLLRINRPALETFQRSNPDNPVCQLLTTPYWFRAHVYFDLVSGKDYVVLTHGKPSVSDVPVVRIQSESLLNRFPIVDDTNESKYNRAVLEIVSYGCGAVVLSYEDGRGAGFGAYALDKMMLEQKESYSTEESYRKIGIGYDNRDYDGLMTVLKEHLVSNKIQMVMNSPNSLVMKKEYAVALNQHELDVVRWIFADEKT